ncbi:MAG: HYR domain-containing protein, partial [Paludibacteraceae bacterium]|nr:HYR domain-containing protein [Paludibacteraceae bacterium]
MTDGNGCDSKKRSFAVKVHAKPNAPTLAVENFCEGSAGTFSADTAGIVWPDGTPSLNDPTKPAGEYIYEYYYKDNNGCESDSKDLKYTVYAKPTAPTVSIDAFCENLEASAKPQLPVSNSGDFAGLEIIWTQSHGSLSALKANKDNYIYKYKVKNDHCESGEASFEVKVYAKPFAPKFEVAEFCEGTKGELDAVSGISANSPDLTWSTQLPDFATLSGGKSYTYEYTYTDGNKCSVDSSLTFNVKAKPTLPILKVENFCFGAKANLDGVPADGTINWANDQKPDYSAAAETYTYKYSYTGTNGCTVDGGELTFTIHPKPADPGLDVADFCEGSTGVLQNKPSTGEIVWTDGKEPDLSGKVGEYSHKYKIVVTNTDDKQCESDEGSFAYKVHALPQLSVTVKQGDEAISASNMACPSKNEKLSVEVNITNGIDGASYTYEWSDDKTVTASAREFELTCGMPNQSYGVKVGRTINALTCYNNLTINVPVTPAPTLTCNNGSDSYPLVNGNTVNVSFTAPTLASTCVDAGGSFKLFEIGDGNAEKLIKESNSWSNLSENLGLGSYNAVFTANDKCLIEGNKNVCEWSFEVTDDDEPSITCKAPLEFEIKSGDKCVYVLQSGDIIKELPEVYENSSLYTLVGVLQGGTAYDKITVNADGSHTGSITFQKGANTIRWTVTDGALNSASCDQTVTVVDKVKPTINCGVDVSVDAKDCNAKVSIVAPETSDNCGGTVTLSAVRLDTKAALTLADDKVEDDFPIGETVIRWYAEDESGNKDSCKQTVTVNDKEPTINCGASPIEEIAPDNSCSWSGEIALPEYSDNCSPKLTATRSDGVSIEIKDGMVNTSAFNIGETKITWTVSDKNGHSKSCEQILIVKDKTKPVLDCMEDVELDADENCQATLTVELPTVKECGPYELKAVARHNGVETAFDTKSVSSMTFGLGTTEIYWTAIDTSKNVGECTQTIKVEDNTKPSITCGGDISKEAVKNCKWLGNIALPDYSDNCVLKDDLVLTVTRDDNASIKLQGGKVSADSFSVGTTKLTWTVSDGKLSESCTQTITVTDTTKPKLTCGGKITEYTSDNSCSWDGQIEVPKVTDNCSYTLTAEAKHHESGKTYSLGVANGYASGIFEKGTTVITWTAKDDKGNTGTCTQDVEVVDNVPPAISCDGMSKTFDITDNSSCEVEHGFALPTYSDNCGATLSYVAKDDKGKVIALTDATDKVSGSFPIGTTTITWTATDKAGNNKECTQTITVNDKANPTIDCGTGLTEAADKDDCLWTGDVTKPTFKDNCTVVTLTYEAKDDKGKVIALTDATDKVSGSFPIGT